MSAYRCGLTGKVAAWAVQKQRQHRQVCERAMMSKTGLGWSKLCENFTKKLDAPKKPWELNKKHVFEFFKVSESESAIRFHPKILDPNVGISKVSSSLGQIVFIAHGSCGQ